MPPEHKSTSGRAILPEASLRHLVLVFLLVTVALCAMAALDPTALQQQMITRFGPGRVALLKDWLQAVELAKSQNDDGKLKRINDFVNRNILFDTDIAVWQKSDYWATPLETIGQGAGDCEDFAIIKYVSLRMAGVPVSKLRLIYVKARLDTPNGPQQQAHMVLAYYMTPESEPQILDNLDVRIRPASKRPDLLPVFSFNSEAIFAGVSGKDKASSGGIGRLSRWEDVMQRIRAEGYD